MHTAIALAVSRPQSGPADDQAGGATGLPAAGLSKSVTVHTLRHSFATHLLEQGVDIRVIRDLLGHRHIKTTAGYARVAVDLIRQVQSPLEHLNLAATAPD
jgi:integrase